MMAKKMKRSSHRPSYIALLDSQIAQLRQVEQRMDDLLSQVVHNLSEETLARASERLDELVVSFSDLRLSGLDAHPQQVSDLLSHLDLEDGPLPGFEQAMATLYASCVTPQAIHQLRHRLYSTAAYVAETCPDFLPTVAVASLSLDARAAERNTFVEMVLCASAIESLICATLSENVPLPTDVSIGLAANPSDTLIAAVGEGQAYYYASIPGVLPFLDQSRVLFDVDQLTRCVRQDGKGLGVLVDKNYKARLCGEIKRVQHALHQRYSDNSIADLQMLTHRALDALDKLPPQVNPLLQAIFVQSWVRYLHGIC